MSNMEIDYDQENTTATMRQSSQQRKASYRSLLNKVEGIQETDDTGLNTVNKLGDVLREANRLDTEWNIEERVEHADETLLDCLVLSSASSLLKKCIEAVDVFTSTYDQTEFSDKIIRTIKSEEAEEIEDRDLLKLLDDARTIIPQVHSYSYVYGTYDLNKIPQPKQKVERQKAQREQLQKKEPEKVTSVDKEEEGIEEIVKVLHDVLTIKYTENNQQPINYYDYIMDMDFANTVENLFYFSFLVRDGRAQIDLDRKGEPVIKPVKKNVLKSFRDEGGVNAQIISCINVEQWQKRRKVGYLQEYKNQTSNSS